MDTNSHLVISVDFLKKVLVYAAASAFMTIGLAFGVAAVVNDHTEDDTNRIVQSTLVEAQQTRQLLCDILAESETESIREAVKLYCEAPETTVP